MTDPHTSGRFAAECQLLMDARMSEPELRSFAGGELAVYSAPNPERAFQPAAEANEDSAVSIQVDRTVGVVAVADGMGGHAGGAKASGLAVQALVECVQAARREDGLVRSGIINGFELANERVQALATGAGTTLAVAEIGPGFVRSYHCGDSIVLAVGNHGKLKLLTVCHSPVGFGVEAGLLDEDEAMHHSDRHLVLNAVGTPDMRIEVGPVIPFSGRDTLLLASDGLTDNLTIEEITNSVRKGRLANSVTTMIATCAARMRGIEDRPSKPDDLTVIAFRVAG